MLIFSPTHPTCKADHCLKLRGCQIYHIQPISASNTQPAVVPAGARTKTYGEKQNKNNSVTGFPFFRPHLEGWYGCIRKKNTSMWGLERAYIGPGLRPGFPFIVVKAMKSYEHMTIGNVCPAAKRGLHASIIKHLFSSASVHHLERRCFFFFIIIASFNSFLL